MQGFPLLLDLPGKPDQQAIHCPTANFGPLSRDNVTKPQLIWPYLFDTKFTGIWRAKDLFQIESPIRGVNFSKNYQ